MARPTRGSTEPKSTYLPFGAWQPDIPTPVGDGMQFALNLVPKTNGFYGPERALQTIGGTQSTTPFGNALKVHGDLHSVPPLTGNAPQYYCGTFALGAGASRLLGRNEQGAWSNLSRGGGYSCTAQTPWRFTNFGFKVLACNLNNTIQISDGNLGTFRGINANISARDIATVRGFAAAIYTGDSTFGTGTQPFRVWWSAIANAENWPDPLGDEAISVQSGFFDLFGGGELQRIVPGIGGADAVVIAERKMWRMRFVGPPQTFEFDEIESDQGTAMPGSVARLDKTFFFFGHNKFHHFDGANSSPIGVGEVDQFFLTDAGFAAAFGRQNAVQAAIDTENNCYVVSYRSDAAATDANDRILRYNWITQRWSNSAIACDTLGHVDSQASAVDAPRIAMIGQAFQIQRPVGATLEVTFDSKEITHDDGMIYRCQGLLIYIDTDSVVAKLLLRDSQGRTPIETEEKGLQADGWIRFAPVVPSGRFYRARFRVPAGTSWTNLTGAIYEYMQLSGGSRVRS